MSAGTGRVVTLQLHSRLLENNYLGDDPRREVMVYLPPGYDAAATERFPSIYVLIGFAGRGRGLLNSQPFELNFAERLDRLIAQSMPPVIAVLPDCFTRYGGSQYINSVTNGPYEDHLVRELVPFVDAQFRTRAVAAARGIVGKSSGGYGAVVLGMRHADTFGAIASHSGDMYFEACYKPDFPKALRTIERCGGLEAWWQSFLAKPKKESSDIEAVNIVAMAAAYSPAPELPLGVELPFDLHTYELRDSVWERWLAHDPVNLAAQHASALRQMRLVHIECGLRDQYNLQYGARIFSARLKALGIAHDHEEFDDNHFGISYRYDVSLPKMARVLSS